MASLTIKDLILLLRPDLCRRFGFDRPEKDRDFFEWLMLTGVKEYPAAILEPQFQQFLHASMCVSTANKAAALSPLEEIILRQRPDVRRAFPLPRKREMFNQWLITHGVEELNLWPFLTEELKNRVRSLPAPWKSRLAPVVSAHEFQPDSASTPVLDEFGVNLIGHAYSPSGTGEDARMAALALAAANVPFVLVDFPRGGETMRELVNLESVKVQEGKFPVNLFCLPALEQGRMTAECGSGQARGRYNIGYWPWELEQWPVHWNKLFCLVDEIWASSFHTLRAIEKVADVPVRHMPMAVSTDGKDPTGCGEDRFENPVARVRQLATRERFHLPARAFLFYFSFDLDSSINRKNPEACLRAFLQAFPSQSWRASHALTEEEVGLVIKVHPPEKKHRGWEKLKALARTDKRVHLIVETLPREQLLELYRACNCFVSLHRAEGFGRGIAEALLLGLKVITTGYSGNMDFCHPPRSELVPYRLVPIGKGEYPFAKGACWADPDIKEAARLMRQTFLHREGTHLEPGDLSCFLPNVIGERYRKRLMEIYSDPNFPSISELGYPRERSGQR